MNLYGCKRLFLGHFNVNGRQWNGSFCRQQWFSSDVSSNSQHFPFLELPPSIICDVFSRLPFKDILRCKSVCKMFLEVIKDPYFISAHLARAPITTTNLILQENIGKHGSHFFKFDLDDSALFSSSSADQNSEGRLHNGLDALKRLTADFTFKAQKVHLVGSSNGLLCLYFDTLPFHSAVKPFYGIYNILLRESFKLPRPSEPTPRGYAYAHHSGFGCCPRTKQYKVVRFMIPIYANHSTIKASRSMVMEILTVGSNSWRLIEDVPNLKWASFDPYLNGALHWMTKTANPSELISTFDLEKEIFVFTPTPSHFTHHYVSKITWINTGVLRNCLCIWYIYEDAEFEVWSMRDYGVRESWTKEFSIKFSFYCNLRVEDLKRPIKFLSNGELLFVSTSACLVSFSPCKKTFRELRSMAPRTTTVTAHDLGFASIKEIAGVRKHKVKSFELVHPKKSGFEYLSFI